MHTAIESRDGGWRQLHRVGSDRPQADTAAEDRVRAINGKAQTRALTSRPFADAEIVRCFCRGRRWNGESIARTRHRLIDGRHGPPPNTPRRRDCVRNAADRRIPAAHRAP